MTAKRRKRTKRVTSVHAKKAEELANKSAGFWRGIGAIALIVAAIIMGFGAFISAPVPAALWNATWWAFGGAAIIAPFVLIYLGLSKFLSEDQQIPLSKLVGSLGLLVFLSGWLYCAFGHTDAATNQLVGGPGGEVGQLVGDLLIDALGKFLASLIFFILVVFSVLFTLGVEPRSLLKIGELFGRGKSEGEEDLAALKDKMSPSFQLHEGVPVEHHKGPAGMAALRNSAQRLSPDQDHAALTTASDPDWQFPPLDLLSDKQDKADAGDVTGNAEIIKDTFNNFNIDVTVEGANVGPRVTQYTIKPPAGVKLTKLTTLENNLALDLAAPSIRMEAPIPGKKAVGIEVPNVKPATVTIRALLNSPEWQESKSALSFAIGKDISGGPIIGDLDTMPHLLIAGQTGSGKSVMINTLLASLLYRNSPSELKLIMVDPKQVELTLYKDIPHLLSPVINEPEKCISALKWAVAEMERRLRAFAEVGKRNIADFNGHQTDSRMPYIVIVIDELADLMMMAARDVEGLIVRLAQKSRAAGIHLVIATQRPSVDVITGLIKANVPARVAFTVVQQVDSRTIIDQAGAEKLLGTGDMLYMIPQFNKPKRLQAALITDGETGKVADFLRKQRPPQYDDEVISQPVQLTGRGGVVSSEGGDSDSAWRDAVEVVVNSGKASTSLLQRKLRIGYGRASRLMDMMEDQGIIAHSDGTNRPRQVLVGSVDEVFGREEPQAKQPEPDIAENDDGDVYDDMPDEENETDTDK